VRRGCCREHPEYPAPALETRQDSTCRTLSVSENGDPQLEEFTGFSPVSDGNVCTAVCVQELLVHRQLPVAGPEQRVQSCGKALRGHQLRPVPPRAWGNSLRNSSRTFNRPCATIKQIQPWNHLQEEGTPWLTQVLAPAHTAWVPASCRLRRLFGSATRRRAHAQTPGRFPHRARMGRARTRSRRTCAAAASFSRDGHQHQKPMRGVVRCRCAAPVPSLQKPPGCMGNNHKRTQVHIRIFCFQPNSLSSKCLNHAQVGPARLGRQCVGVH
jgi:hypothetical protein